MTEKPDKNERLATALRENLRKRKAQARAVAAPILNDSNGSRER